MIKRVGEILLAISGLIGFLVALLTLFRDYQSHPEDWAIISSVPERILAPFLVTYEVNIVFFWLIVTFGIMSLLGSTLVVFGPINDAIKELGDLDEIIDDRPIKEKIKDYTSDRFADTIWVWRWKELKIGKIYPTDFVAICPNDGSELYEEEIKRNDTSSFISIKSDEASRNNSTSRLKCSSCDFVSETWDGYNNENKINLAKRIISELELRFPNNTINEVSPQKSF